MPEAAIPYRDRIVPIMQAITDRLSEITDYEAAADDLEMLINALEPIQLELEDLLPSERTAPPTATPTATPLPTPELTAKELDDLLATQPLAVVRTQYIVQSEDHRALYPDMLSAVVRNNGEDDIRDAVLAFAAWDVNGLPIKLKGNIDFSDGSYIQKAKASGINLIPGTEWGKTGGYSIDEDLDIDSFVAVAVSYTSFDDEEWENEYFIEWSAMYGGKRRPESVP